MSVEAVEDDSDVIWQGSPLYSHLLEHGLLEDTAVEQRPEDKIVISRSPLPPPSLDNEITNE